MSEELVFTVTSESDDPVPDVVVGPEDVLAGAASFQVEAAPVHGPSILRMAYESWRNAPTGIFPGWSD